MKTVIFDLAVLLVPPVQRKHYLLHYLDKAGVPLGVRSSLNRNNTKAILRDAELLPYFTDLYFNGGGFSEENAVYVHQPAHARLAWIEKALDTQVNVPAYIRVMT